MFTTHNEELYYNWLKSIIEVGRFDRDLSYDALLLYLYNREFVYFLGTDADRASRGENLRWNYSVQTGTCYDESFMDLKKPCSVLEMMVALAIDCEDIMSNPLFDDRTGDWFWKMIANLGLGSMYGKYFDEEKVASIINRFLNRKYLPNGEGGLFVLRNCKYDLTKIDIWYQLCWYLDTLYM